MELIDLPEELLCGILEFTNSCNDYTNLCKALEREVNRKHMLNIHTKIIEKENGDIKYLVNGLLHRENDLPALIWKDGTQVWYQHGKVYRENNKPDIICSDGSEIDYEHIDCEYPNSRIHWSTYYRLNDNDINKRVIESRIKNKPKLLPLYYYLLPKTTKVLTGLSDETIKLILVNNYNAYFNLRGCFVNYIHKDEDNIIVYTSDKYLNDLYELEDFENVTHTDFVFYDNFFPPMEYALVRVN